MGRVGDYSPFQQPGHGFLRRATADDFLAALFTDQNMAELRKEVERRGVGLTIPQLRVVLEAAAVGGAR